MKEKFLRLIEQIAQLQPGFEISDHGTIRLKDGKDTPRGGYD